MFWQAIVAREARGENSEERPRSFLVAPTVPPPRLDLLHSLNIRHVPATAEDFLRWLSNTHPHEQRTTVLRRLVPEDMEILDRPFDHVVIEQALPHFLAAFPRVPDTTTLLAGHPKTFFLGAPPTWHDIAAEFDAPRESTTSLLDAVHEALSDESQLHALAVLGAGGAGKSTMLKRVAHSLRRDGHHVFFSEGYDRPAYDDVYNGLRAFGDKSARILRWRIVGRPEGDYDRRLWRLGAGGGVFGAGPGLGGGPAGLGRGPERLAETRGVGAAARRLRKAGVGGGQI